MRVLRACAAVLNRTLEGTECLRPEAVFPAIPEQKGDRAMPAIGIVRLAVVPTPSAERDPVLEVAIGLMACAARDRAVRAQPRVEEQPPAEIRGSRIVGDAIGGIGRQ